MHSFSLSTSQARGRVCVFVCVCQERETGIMLGSLRPAVSLSSGTAVPRILRQRYFLVSSTQKGEQMENWSKPSSWVREENILFPPSL